MARTEELIHRDLCKKKRLIKREKMKKTGAEMVKTRTIEENSQFLG